MQRIDIHIFTSGDEAWSGVEEALSDRRLTKARPARYAGDLAAAITKYEHEPSPGLLIIETHEAPAMLFDQLDRLSAVCKGDTQVVLVGRHNDVGLYRQLLRRGVSEYLNTPIDPRHLAEILIAVCAGPDNSRQGRLISFIGASGGAGSTTIANNVAWQLGKVFADEVTLIDLDLASGTVGLDFNLESPQTVAQALAQADRLDDQMLERFLISYNDNLALITAPGDCGTPADIDTMALDSFLAVLRRNAAWVVLDLPRQWTGWVRHVLDASDEIVVTAAPTLASLRNAKSAVDLLSASRRNDSPVRVVLNRSGANPKTDIPVKDFAGTFGGKPSAIVPNEPTIVAAATTRGQMVGESAKGSRMVEPLRRLAVMVSGRPEPQKPKRFAWPRLLPATLAWSR
jgi:pilus assembly protein CpaE